MPTSITLPGGLTGTNGPVLGPPSAIQYTRQLNVSLPTSTQGVRQDLGGIYRVRVHSINPDRVSGNPSLRITVSGQNYGPNDTYSASSLPTVGELRIFYETAQPTWYRNNDNSTQSLTFATRCQDLRTSDGFVLYTYSGSVAGTWSWATVPTAPASISVVVSGTSATITRGNSTADTSYPVTSYSIQRRESTNGTTWGAWGNTTTMVGSTHTYTGLTAARYYQFRVYASNSIGTSQAVQSTTAFIAAVTRYDGSNFVLLSKLKRYNGTSWTSIGSAKRWNGTAWEIIDISSIPNT